MSIKISSVTVQEMVTELQCEYHVLGSINRRISSVIPLSEEQDGGLTFSSAKTDAVDKIRKSGAEVVICSDKEEYPDDIIANKTLVLVANPRLAFARVVRGLSPVKKARGIHPMAVVHPQAIVDPTAYVGPFVYIGRSSIGPGTVILGHSYIYDRCQVGANVTIHAGCVIGADGFGYEQNPDGDWEKFPQLGGVIIEDDVELHAMTHVAQGAISPTVIGQGSKIDAQCHIAHNVVIGKRCVITAHAELSGGVQVGDGVWIAPGVCVREKVRIGSRAVIGMGSAVTKDVPEGITVMGAPARPADEFKKMLRQLAKGT